MSENLEIIKNEVKNFGEQSIKTSLDIIITTAECMAAEIERLETADVLSDEVAFKNTKYIEELEAEIARLKAELKRLKGQGKIACELFDEIKILQKENIHLKAELEKRPEVVYCEGCIYKNQCKAAVIFQESTPKMEGPFKFYYLKFCSFGQRKNEEGK